MEQIAGDQKKLGGIEQVSGARVDQSLLGYTWMTESEHFWSPGTSFVIGSRIFDSHKPMESIHQLRKHKHLVPFSGHDRVQATAYILY